MPSEPIAECLSCPQVDWYFVDDAGAIAKRKRTWVIWHEDGVLLHRLEGHDVWRLDRGFENVPDPTRYAEHRKNGAGWERK